MSYYPPGPPTGPAYPSAPFPAVPPEEPHNRRTLTLVLIAVVAVLALIFASVVVLVVRGGNSPFKIPGLSLLTRDNPGPNPFGPNVALSNKDLPSGMRLSAQVGAMNQGTRVVSGTQPGLYAGGDSTCDAAGLGNYLGQHPSQARAWASVFGISTESIPYYLNTLTPVVLTADTWVTNHSYTDGAAYAFQSVLQSGTAVLVDGAGVPRVRCACGNPLSPPANAPVGGYRLSGAPWPGYTSHHVTRVAYNTQNVTVVNNTTTVVNQQAPAAGAVPVETALTLVNLGTGQLFERPVGNILNLNGLPPLATPLPTPASLNTPFVASSDSQAADNGLQKAGSPEVAPEVQQLAKTNADLPEGAPESTPAAGASGSEQPEQPSESTGTTAPGENPAAESTSVSAPVATDFSGTGDSVGSFSFVADGKSTTCQAPSTESSGPVSLTCSDNVAREVSASALERASVLSATDPTTKVWTLTVTEVAASKSVTVDVTSATWQTLETSTTTTQTTTPETTTETTTPETTTETTTPETTTETTTTETTTEAPLDTTTDTTTTPVP